jgi:hypothetical protein
MRKFLDILAIAFLIGGGTAYACPPNSAASSVKIFAPLPRQAGVYYCSTSPAPQSVGDLSYAGWARHVQVCTHWCSYEPMAPGVADSPLIETSCGPGYHDESYYVDPPQPPAGYTAINLKNPSCNALAPPKAASTPQPR